MKVNAQTLIVLCALRRISLVQIFSAAFFFITLSSQAQYSLQNALPNLASFSFPVEMASPADGSNRLFVVQQRGKIYVFQKASNVITRKEFLDLSDKVSQSGSETGLLGLAFHPNYSTNGYFYVNYTATISGQLQTFVSRFQVSPANPDSAVKTSEFVLLNVNQPYPNHNGGKVLFGPDGYLYIALGDGGSAGDPQNNAQNRSVLLGKILRINVDSPSGGRNYSIPPTNPYVGNTQGFREEIFAYGLRNPWKISFDPLLGTLWAADVGQNAWEEIDIIESGGNYGWRIMEGNACYNPSTGCDTSGLIKPIWVYSHNNNDISITGGYVYRGSHIPSLTGKYIYADYGSGRIWALDYTGVIGVANQLLLDSPYLISSFGEDAERNLYVLSYQDGRIYKLLGPDTPVETDTPPSQSFLGQNYPNPFNPKTSFEFTVARQTDGGQASSQLVSIKVFDVLGREVAVLVHEERAPGAYTLTWDASALPSGIYLYRMQAGSFVATRKMVFAK